MTRRIVRTVIQLGILTTIVLILIFFLDNHFGVLPEAIHNALPAHHPGLVITDITLASCSSLNILSSCKLDPEKWHRIERDLYLSREWLSHAYIHIKRKQESELKESDRVIVDVRISKTEPAAVDPHDAEKWESRPGGIWLKRTAKRHASDSVKAITAVDVLFGSDAVEPRPGWHLIQQPVLLGDPGDNEEVHLTVRRGTLIPVEKPVLHVHKDGKFKILQVSDLHFSTGLGVCRDPEPPSVSKNGKCDADPRTLDFINSVLDAEKPDLVILSGDQINGETSPDSQSALFKVVQIFISRRIPFATIFGNHDNEGSVSSREDLMQLTQALPYSLSHSGPIDVDGTGNYYVEVLARGQSTHSALTIYLLDTHGYSPDERQFRGYDWIKPSQIDWFKSTAQALKHSPSHRDYTHVHMDMAFIHIPLPEYGNKADIFPGSGKYRETPTAPSFNSGFKSALVEEGVLAVSCGHDHANDYCALSKSADPANKPANKPELWMCYAGGAGFGGYGGYPGQRRKVRVFEFDMNEASIGTWKRVENGGNATEGGNIGGREDEIIIVEGGKVVSP